MFVLLLGAPKLFILHVSGKSDDFWFHLSDEFNVDLSGAINAIWFNYYYVECSELGDLSWTDSYMEDSSLTRYHQSEFILNHFYLL